MKKEKSQWIMQKYKKKYLETNDNEKTTIQNLWNATKAVLRGKFIVIQAFLKQAGGITQTSGKLQSYSNQDSTSTKTDIQTNGTE